MDFADIRQDTYTYITWAVVNDRIEWIFGEVEHKDWLRERFNITQRQFEETIRGYISKQRDNKIDIAYFKGRI